MVQEEVVTNKLVAAAEELEGCYHTVYNLSNKMGQ